MKTKILIITLFLLFQNLFAQNITGNWFGSLDIQGQKLPLVLHISEKNKVYTSTFDSPLQGAKDIPIELTTFINNELTINATKVGFTFKGKLINEKFEGDFSQNGMNLPMTLSRNEEKIVQNRPQEPKPPYDYDNEEVSFENIKQGNILAGTITSPKNFNKNNKILVMITGSGSQDRNEEMLGHKFFLVIADDLAKKGIATLRIDDRGIGGSEKGTVGATSQDFATDISSAVQFLVIKGYTNIGLIGHSEGGMIAPMVADQNKNVKYMVLLAGPGVPIEDLMVKQNSAISRISGVDEKTVAKLELSNKKIFSFANNYKGENFEKDLQTLLISEIKNNADEKLSDDIIKQQAQDQVKSLAEPWFRYFLKYNPDQYLSKIKIPVLALNGSLDQQVSSKENLAAIKKSLTKAENKNFEIVEVKNLNHLFQTAITGNPSEYGQIEETFSPVALDIISDWILKLK